MSEADQHFDDVVLPAIAAYQAAEQVLSVACGNQATDQIAAARLAVVRAARTACVELHQFADVVADLPPPWAPATVTGPDTVRAWVQTNASLGQGRSPDDVEILHDVADAFKHSRLTRPRKGRDHWVKRAGAAVITATGYGRLGFGEGKFGGVEQVIVTLETGKDRALSSILQDALDAWLYSMGRPLQPVEE